MWGSSLDKKRSSSSLTTRDVWVSWEKCGLGCAPSLWITHKCKQSFHSTFPIYLRKNRPGRGRQRCVPNETWGFTARMDWQFHLLTREDMDSQRFWRICSAWPSECSCITERVHIEMTPLYVSESQGMKAGNGPQFPFIPQRHYTYWNEREPEQTCLDA